MKLKDKVDVAKNIQFENDGKTVYGKPEYIVKNKSGGNALARIIWNQPRREWVVRIRPNTIWSKDCLSDIYKYLQSLSK